MTTRNHPTKIGLVALALCLLILCPMLLACDELGGGTATTTTATTTTTTTTVLPGGNSTPPPATKIRTTLAQLELDGDGGMCYIIQLSDGRFIIIDGGLSSANHKARLYAYLTEKSPTAKPVIACWIITHLDGDHWNNMYSFLSTYRYGVDLQRFAYTFPEEADFAIKSGDSQSVKDYKNSALTSMENKLAEFENIRRWFPGLVLWDMKTLDEQKLDDVHMRVLMTANERVPQQIYSHNQRSAVIKFTFTRGTEATVDDITFLMLGDNGGGGAYSSESDARNKWLVDHYDASVLKSDIMQVAHHGLKGGYLPLYQAVDPLICLWPSPEYRFNGRHDNDKDGSYTDDYQWCTEAAYNVWLRDNSIRVRKHFHHSQTTVIDILTLTVTTDWKMTQITQ